MIKKRYLDRGDSSLYIENQAKLEDNSKLRIIKSDKNKSINNIIFLKPKGSSLSNFIAKNSHYMNYWEYLINTSVGLEMRPGDYFAIVEKREVNEDYDDAFLVHMVSQINELKYYIYKNEDGDILYFRNPFYEGNIINELAGIYEKMESTGAHKKSGDTLEEIPEYNHKLSEEMLRLGFNAFDPNGASEEFRLQIKGMTDLIKGNNQILLKKPRILDKSNPGL